MRFATLQPLNALLPFNKKIILLFTVACVVDYVSLFSVTDHAYYTFAIP